MIATCTGQPQQKIQFNSFPILAIIEHTENILNPNKGIITSLLKLFAIFQLRLFDDK